MGLRSAFLAALIASNPSKSAAYTPGGLPSGVAGYKQFNMLKGENMLPQANELLPPTQQWQEQFFAGKNAEEVSSDIYQRKENASLLESEELKVEANELIKEFECQKEALEAEQAALEELNERAIMCHDTYEEKLSTCNDWIKHTPEQCVADGLITNLIGFSADVWTKKDSSGQITASTIAIRGSLDLGLLAKEKENPVGHRMAESNWVSTNLNSNLLAGPSEPTSSENQLGENLVRAVRALTPADAPVHVTGHSMGGEVATRATLLVDGVTSCTNFNPSDTNRAQVEHRAQELDISREKLEERSQKITNHMNPKDPVHWGNNKLNRLKYALTQNDDLKQTLSTPEYMGKAPFGTDVINELPANPGKFNPAYNHLTDATIIKFAKEVENGRKKTASEIMLINLAISRIKEHEESRIKSPGSTKGGSFSQGHWSQGSHANYF